MQLTSLTLAPYTMYALRKMKGITSVELARQLKVVHNYVTVFENGSRPLPKSVRAKLPEIFEEPLTLTDPELDRVSELLMEDPKLVLIASRLLLVRLGKKLKEKDNATTE